MSWNYRVMRGKNTGTVYSPEEDGEFWFAVYEVYYGANGEVVGWSTSPAVPTGETLGELDGTCQRIKDATLKPVLDYHTGKEINGG